MSPNKRMQKARALVARYVALRSAHTPKPEKALEDLIRQKLAYINRRRGKPPLLVWIPQEGA